MDEFGDCFEFVSSAFILRLVAFFLDIVCSISDNLSKRYVFVLIYLNGGFMGDGGLFGKLVFREQDC